MSRNATADRIRRSRTLDGLRGIAALSVFVFHIWLYPLDHPERAWRMETWSDSVLSQMRTGLYFFFVLSGYLLYRRFARKLLAGSRKLELGRYLRRRLARILPAYYLVMIGSVALLWGSSPQLGIRLPPADELWRFLIFAQNYSTDTLLTLNPVTWTLCLEMLFYLALPALALAGMALHWRGAAQQAIILSGWVAAGVVWAGLVRFLDWQGPITKLLFLYLPYFALGMLVALWGEVRRRRGWVYLEGRTSALLMVGGWVVVVINGYWHATVLRADSVLLDLLRDIPAGVGFAMIVAACAGGRGWWVEWPARFGLARLGVISYGFYLWHMPILWFGRRIGLPLEGFWQTLAYCLPLTLVCAWASWRWVEAPALAWAARRSHRRSRQGEPPPATVEAGRVGRWEASLAG